MINLSNPGEIPLRKTIGPFKWQPAAVSLQAPLGDRWCFFLKVMGEELPVDIKERIIGELLIHPEGIKAKDIANNIGISRKEVNRVLYSKGNSDFLRNDKYQWTYVGKNQSKGTYSQTTKTVSVGLKDKIITTLSKYPNGVKAKVIAKEIGVSRADVNRILYGGKGKDFSQNVFFVWKYIERIQSIRLDYTSVVIANWNPLPVSGLSDVVISILKRSGKIEEYNCKAYKDPKDDLYYIEKTEYDTIKSSGTPLVQLYDYSGTSSKPSRSSFNNLPLKSIISACGYTTSIIDDLSDKERECILEMIIHNGLRTKIEVTRHLEWCIKNHQDKMYSENRKKWERDIAFLKTL